MAARELVLTKKGALYTCACKFCGATMYAHEWADENYRDRLAAMKSGKLCCDGCGYGKADPDTVKYEGRFYAGCYLAPDYGFGCTPWEYHITRRELVQALREIYGN